MDVSVCIVNWNTRELLCQCIDSVIRLTGPKVSYEIIVVDNCSADGSVEAVRSRFPEVRVVASEENLGFARGCNLAASQANGRYIFYLNPDTEFVTDAMTGMLEEIERDPGIGAVGCRLLNSDGSIQYTCACDVPSPWNELCSLLGLDRLFPRSRLFSARELGYWDHQDTRDVECLSGACMLLSRELDSRLRGFDESFFMYGEDVDLCLRIREAGYRLRYLASEVIYHHEGAGSRKRGRDFAPVRQRAANLRVMARHDGALKAFLYRMAVLAGSTGRFVGVAIAAPVILAFRPSARERLAHVLQRYGGLAMWAMGLRQPA
jgi:GT2 family glycosyltransferase